MLAGPAMLDPFHRVVGHPQASAPVHVWVLWWAKHHLAELHTTLLFHPHGADVVQLYGSDVLSPLLLAWLPLPPAFLYDLWVVGLLVAGGVGAERLCRRLGAEAGGARVGGTVFATAPFFQHELLNGTSELIAAAFLPWFAVALLDALDGPSLRRGAALGAWVGVATLASAYNLFFVLLLGACVVVHRLATVREPVLTPPVLGSLGTGAAVAAAFGAPLAWLHATHGSGATYQRRVAFDAADAAMPDAFADLVEWVDPRAAAIPELVPLQGAEMFEYWTTCTVYVGFAALGLAAVGAWRRRSLGAFGVAAAVAFLIALGPWLRAGGELVSVAGVPVPMPARTLAALFPPFLVTAVHAYRYAAVVMLGVGVLAAFAVRRPAWAALIVADALLLSPVPWPMPYTDVAASPVLDELAAMPDGAVLVAPTEGEHLGDLGRMLLGQVTHGKPVHDGGIHHRAPAGATALFGEVPMLGDLAVRPAPRFPDATVTAWSLARLHDAGYRYVLVPASEAEAVAWMEATTGPPHRQDDRWALWRIEAGLPSDTP